MVFIAIVFFNFYYYTRVFLYFKSIYSCRYEDHSWFLRLFETYVDPIFIKDMYIVIPWTYVMYKSVKYSLCSLTKLD